MPVFYKNENWKQGNVEIVSQTINIVVDPSAIYSNVDIKNIEYNTTITTPELSGTDPVSIAVIGVTQNNLAQYIVPITLVSNLDGAIKLTPEILNARNDVGGQSNKYKSIYIVASINTNPLPITFGDDIIIQTSQLYFNRSVLFSWLTPQQLNQFEQQSQNSILYAYNNALGKIRIEIGNKSDIDGELAKIDEETKDQSFLWLLVVFTATMIANVSFGLSVPLQDAYDKGCEALMRLKAETSSLTATPESIDPEAPESFVFTNSKSYRG